jgi:HlyD family secretion protein
MKPVRILIFITLVFTLGACNIFQHDGSQTNLSASGVMAGTNVSIASEMGGKVSDVYAAEGDSVKPGDVLFKLDCSLLLGQRDVAQAAVQSANDALASAKSAYATTQAQYDAAVVAARVQQGATRLSDWLQREPGKFEQPLWYFSQEEQIVSAQTEVESARQALQQARANLDEVVKSLNNSDFVNAESRLRDARVSYLVAKAVRDHAQATGGKVSPDDVEVGDLPPYVPAYRVKIRIAKALSTENGDVFTTSKDALDVAETELNDAQDNYNSLLNTDAADRVLEARAAVSVARERYEVAQDTLSQLQIGEYSPQVKIASLGLDQADDGVQQTQGGINQAEAALKLIDLQIEKCTVKAPQAGFITSRNLESGEMIAPAGTVMVISKLNPLTLTVYVPEDLYGQVALGQPVSISVDSFPKQAFSGTVKYIASEGEFTPRNVQTVEGRKSTVYAVKIEVPNEQGLLKPGMPADVIFDVNYVE